MVATKKNILAIVKVTIKNIENIIPATKNGHFRIFCNAIEIMITAIGIAKYNNKIFIIFSFSFFMYIMLLPMFLLKYIVYSYSTFNKNNPLAGNVLPAFSLFLEFIIWVILSGPSFPSPTSTNVPAIILTMLYKKPFPVNSM